MGISAAQVGHRFLHYRAEAEQTPEWSTPLRWLSGTPTSHAGILHCTGSLESLAVPDTSMSSLLAPVFSLKGSPWFSLCNDASEAHWEPGFISLKTLASLRGICRWWHGEGGRVVIRMLYASCHILIQLRKRGLRSPLSPRPLALRIMGINAHVCVSLGIWATLAGR